jgi:hypothetical protein
MENFLVFIPFDLFIFLIFKFHNRFSQNLKKKKKKKEREKKRKKQPREGTCVCDLVVGAVFVCVIN